MSLVLRPRTAPSALGPLGLAAAVAVAEAIEGLGVGGVALKWPNDVLVSGRKVAGILAEAAAEAGRVRHVIVGIGVNLNVARFPADLRDRATSLHRVAGASVDRTAFAMALCRHLERWIDRFGDEGAEPVVRAWLDRGRLGPVTVAAGTFTVTGVAEGLDPDGALRVRRDDGVLEVVRSGEIAG
jgi:BirA family biotin operon repressor/biotin-[acetyl-CoA-carboxylase] ligase